MEQYVEIKRFPFIEIAQEISAIFDLQGIDYVIENTKPSVDITFTNGGIIEYILKVKQSQKEKALEILTHSFVEDISAENHFMDSFSDDELFETISMPDEWDEADLEYAKELLEKRGLVLDASKIKDAREKVISARYEPQKAKGVVIFVGYLFAFLGGWLGLIIALHLLFKHVKGENNEVINYYDRKSRNHGITICIIFSTWVILFLLFFLVF